MASPRFYREWVLTLQRVDQLFPLELMSSVLCNHQLAVERDHWCALEIKGKHHGRIAYPCNNRTSEADERFLIGSPVQLRDKTGIERVTPKHETAFPVYCNRVGFNAIF